MKTKSGTILSRSPSDAGGSDEGPPPMRKFRPSKKNPNASDRFHEDHQGEYEARDRRSDDRVAIVEEHNSGYPKMRDELDNRRAIAKPTVTRGDGRGRYTTRCQVCGGYERQHTKRKYQRTKSRITKRRPKTQKYRGKKPRQNAVSHYAKTRTYTMDTQTRDKDAHQDQRASMSIRINRAESENGSNKSYIDYKNPRPSVSSYESFLPSDHEPMD